MPNPGLPFFEGEIRSNLTSGDSPTIEAGIGKALHNLGVAMDEMKTTFGKLDQSIKGFSDATTELSKKANTIIFWYTIFTAVIAIATVINIFLNI